MRIQFHKNFTKKYIKLRASERKKLEERLHIFSAAPFDPQLRNHPLQGKYMGYRSINITGDLRAIYRLSANGTVVFADIDTHSNLY